MRFQVEHSVLAPALAIVSRAIPSRSVRPVLSSVLVEAREGSLTLAGTDLDTACLTTVPATVEEEGRAAIPARYLTDITRRIPRGLISWESAPGAATVQLSWDRSQYTIHGFDPTEYPSIPAFPDTGDRTLPQGVLKHAIAHSAFAAAQDETARALLTGVELRLLPGSIFALATDGFHAAAYASDPASSRPVEDAMVVPATVLSELAHLLAESDEPCDIARQGNLVLFRAGSTHLAARLLEGRYFAVLDLVPKAFLATIRVQRELLLGACERVGLITEKDPPHAILLSAEDALLQLDATSPDVGTAHEELAMKADGEPVHLGFNGRQLAEGLRRFTGNDVVLEVSGPKSLARITDPNDGRLQYLQMPLQMPE